MKYQNTTIDSVTDGWSFQEALVYSENTSKSTLLSDCLKAVSRHPAYQDTASDITPWEELPVINKAWVDRQFFYFAQHCNLSPGDIELYIEHFDIDGTLGDFLVFHSSGSSGIRSYSIYSLFDFGRSLYALYNRTLKPYGITRLAYIGLLDRYNGGNQWMHHLRPHLQVKSIDIFEPIETIAEALLASKSEAIFTKPSILCRLVDYGLDQGISFTNVRHLISVGENISTHQSDIITEFFGVAPLNSFSTTETGPIGFQDDPAKRQLTLYNELNHVEIVGDDGHVILTAGTPGSLVVSNLYNTHFPLLRYDLQDVVEWVPGGVGKKISFVKGRSAKTLSFFGHQETLNELALWEFEHEAILDCQFHQPDSRSLSVDVIPRQSTLTHETIRRAVNAHLLASGMNQTPDIQVTFVNSISPDPNTSKVKRLLG